MKKLLPALCLLSIFTCRAGTVQTFSGETYEGDVRLDSSGITVTPAGAAIVKVDLGNILDANFADKETAKNYQVHGVTLKSGSIIAGSVDSLDAVSLKIGGQDVKVPATEISRVVFQRIPQNIEAQIQPGHFGALLSNGDLFEGEVRGITDGRVKVISPIFGLRNFYGKPEQPWLKSELLAVLLRDVEKTNAQYEVQTKDGSLYLADNLQIATDALALQVPVIGAVKIPADQVVAIRAGGGRYQNLVLLQPRRVDPPAGINPAAAFNVNHTAANEPLTVSGETFSQGIETTVSTVVSYPVQAGFGTFTAQAGIPGKTPATTKLVFAVYADGRSVFKSPPRSSADKPLPIRVVYGNAQTLSLRVEPALPGNAAGSGIWGEPRLLKR